MSVESSSSFEALPSRRVGALLGLGEKIWQARPDVRKAYGHVSSWEFWYWLMWHGSNEYPDVKAALYPLPCGHLLERVVGLTPPRQYLESGLVDWRRILLCCQQAGFDFARGGRILDFGCGCGRILQCFARYADTCTLHGVDVDGEAIAWCQTNFDFASFSVVPRVPPTSLPAASFDVVYAFSVLSHLPERLHLLWLEELARLTRPCATLVLTTMGKRCADEFASGKKGLIGSIPNRTEMRRDMSRLLEDGFAFYPYGNLEFDNARNREFFEDWDMEQYGSTFILESYVRRRWLDRFELVAYNQAPDDWQDYVVLRRR